MMESPGNDRATPLEWSEQAQAASFDHADVTDNDRAHGDVVCLGMLHAVPCRILKQRQPIGEHDISDNRLDDTRISLRVEVSQTRCLLTLGTAGPIAVVSKRVGDALIELLPSIRLLVYAPSKRITHVLSKQNVDPKVTDVTKVEINVYAERESALEIGKKLSKRELYLQEPDWFEPTIPLQNPQVLVLGELSEADVLLSELCLDQPIIEEQKQWTSLLDRLGSDMTAFTHVQIPDAKVSLQEHQIAAVDFMSARELNDLAPALRYWQEISPHEIPPTYQHTVTRAEQKCQERPAEPRGGILADEMGVGKTLSTLALVMSSRDRAMAFAQSKRESVPGPGQMETTYMRCTLVVVPSLHILSNWVDEIDSKLKRNSITYAVYHGQHRARHYSELQDYDIILTTYGTITREHRRQTARDVLFKVVWFRVVLDEGHVIRSPKARQAQSIMQLQVMHPWCLTGTPISNKVDDLQSLLQFCQVPLLSDPKCFQDVLVKATRKNFATGSNRIHRALAPICLRRSRKHLNLPETHQFTVKVTLSPAERHSYSALMEQSRLDLDATTAGKSNVRSTMLQAILRLRLLCSRGTSLLYDTALMSNAYDPDETLALLQQDDQAHCCVCLSQVVMLDQGDELGSGVLLSCSHLLCNTCYEEATAGQEQTTFRCQVCEKTVGRIVQQIGRPVAAATSVQSSTKLHLLMQTLQRTFGHEKSLVLSAWRKTIGTVAALCKDRGITYALIDGSIPQAERPSILQHFVDDKSISVLLMTLGTGALGLNITAATQIHLLEPQWNPSVEDQAIGRLVRIGQANETTVTRYVTVETVEEQVQLYQSYKTRLAAAGFGDSSAASQQAQHRLLRATFFTKPVSR